MSRWTDPPRARHRDSTLFGKSQKREYQKREKSRGEKGLPKTPKTRVPETPKTRVPGEDRGNPQNPKTTKTTNPGKGGSRGIKGDKGGTGGDPGKSPKTPKSYHKTRVFGLRQFEGAKPCFKGCFKGGEIKAEIGGVKNVKNPKTPFPTQTRPREELRSVTQGEQSCRPIGKREPTVTSRGLLSTSSSEPVRCFVTYHVLWTIMLMMIYKMFIDLQDLPVAVPHKPLCLVHLLGSIPDPSEPLPDLLCPTPSPPTPPSPPPLYINAKNRKKDVSEGWGIKPVLIGKSHRQPDRPLFFRTKW